MPKTENTEQEICINCGFCCDGTLFNHAITEDKSHPLIDIEIRDGDKNRFKLPCHLFKNGCCSIYDQPRPNICGDFKCKQLHLLNRNRVSEEEVQSKIEKVKALKQEIEDGIAPYIKSNNGSIKENFALFKANQLEELNEKEFNKTFAPLLVKYQLLLQYLKVHFHKGSKKKAAEQ